MSWFVLSLLSVFVLASAELIQQHLLNLKNSFNERASSVFTFLFMAFLTLPIVFIFSLQKELLSVFDGNIIFKVFIVAILASIAMIFYLKSFKVKNISFSTIFISASTIISTTLGIMFLNEGIYTLKFVGVFMILLAIVVLNFKKSTLEKNNYYGLLAGAIFGITYTLDKSVVLNIHPLIYLFWICFLIALFGFLFNPMNVINSIKGKKIIDYRPIALSGLGYFLYNFFTFSAYKSGGEVGKIDAINNSEVFLIIIFEFFILKNTKSIFLKIFTAMIAAIGVFILGKY